MIFSYFFENVCPYQNILNTLNNISRKYDKIQSMISEINNDGLDWDYYDFYNSWLFKYPQTYLNILSFILVSYSSFSDSPKIDLLIASAHIQLISITSILSPKHL